VSRVAQRLLEGLARRTTRRGFARTSAEAAFGALAGVALGRGGIVYGGGPTVCAFPFGHPCPCDGCLETGVCAKPCLLSVEFYAAGCWVTVLANDAVTCCDCDCSRLGESRLCGCGSDYHTNPAFCP
jgi:hypothetical protein